MIIILTTFRSRTTYLDCVGCKVGSSGVYIGFKGTTSWPIELVNFNGLQGESLNGGGQLFVAKNKNLHVRVVTGDTLTAAIVLDRLPKDVKEVFLTGSSEISRAIAIYLCRRGVRVLVCCIASFQLRWMCLIRCLILCRHLNFEWWMVGCKYKNGRQKAMCCNDIELDAIINITGGPVWSINN